MATIFKNRSISIGWGLFFTALLLSLSCNQMIAAESVSEDDQNNSEQISLNPMTPDQLSKQALLKLTYRTFDPLTEVPRIDSPALAAVPGIGTSLYIVQFYTIAFETFQNKIWELGGEVIEPLPDHALIVQMDQHTKNRISALPYVRWVGYYYPAYKIAPNAINRSALTSDACYSIWLSEVGFQPDVIDFIEQIGGKVPGSTDSRRLEAGLTQHQLFAVAQLNDVLAIDLCTPFEDDMDGIREASGANYIETVKGYTGQGVGAEVIDRGYRMTHQDFQANKLILHSPASHTASAGMNHGTECAGIMFGSGASDIRARGLMPNAARPIVASRFSLWPNSSGMPTLTERKTHTAELIEETGIYRAVLQTSSWGNTQTTSYTTISAEMDEILFELDFLALQSQSNTGNTNSRPQAWAKNIVAVGGVVNQDTLTRSDDCWCNRASIGPASDGRIKPDLSHFYGTIYTVDDASDTAHREFGGTSGATPATAGLFGLMFQMWADGILDGGPGKNRDVFTYRPHMTTAKALMIHTAYRYDFTGQNHDLSRVHQGWGTADVKLLYDSAKAHGWKFPHLIDESEVITQSQVHSYTVKSDGSQPLRATMVYADPAGNPSAAVHRINDLTLKVTDPTGVIYWGNNGLIDGNWSTQGGTANTIDTVENVFIQTPVPGIWTIEVVASEIVKDAHTETTAMDADYALIVSGGTKGTPSPQYTLATNVIGQGSITLNPMGGTYDEGTVVTLTAVPIIGWKFNGWSGDVTGITNPAKVTMSANKTVTATFIKSTTLQYQLTTSAVGEGSIALNPAGGIYDEGTQVTLTATPLPGWQFDGWNGDIIGITNPVTTTMSGDKTVTANFSQVTIVQYTLTTSVVGQGEITLDPPGGLYDGGTLVTITAKETGEWLFDGWKGDLTGKTNPATLTMGADKTITATFIND